MLEAFIVTLREGVEAALIVGITLAYLSKINRPELRIIRDPGDEARANCEDRQVGHHLVELPR